MLLRMIKLIIKTNRQLEDARHALFCHQAFSLQESFSLFDIKQNGRIGAEEIAQVFREQSIPCTKNIARVVQIIDADNHAFITFDKWFAALKPKQPFTATDKPDQDLSKEQGTLY